MGTAKDDHRPRCRPEAAVHKQNDDIADAPYVWFPYLDVPQRLGPLLGSIQHNWHHNSIFRYWWLGLLKTPFSVPVKIVKKN